MRRFAPGNHEGSVDARARLCKSDEVGKVGNLELVVVRDAEEDRLDAAPSRHTGPTVFWWLDR
jgi:hypothetical protein